MFVLMVGHLTWGQWLPWRRTRYLICDLRPPAVPVTALTHTVPLQPLSQSTLHQNWCKSHSWRCWFFCSCFSRQVLTVGPHPKSHSKARVDKSYMFWFLLIPYSSVHWRSYILRGEYSGGNSLNTEIFLDINDEVSHFPMFVIQHVLR